MLRFHFLQWWFGLSDPTMKKALHDASLYCEFVWLEPGSMRLPDESAILRFYHLLEENRFSIQMLATINATLVVKWPTLKCGKVVDATRLAALRAIKNSGGEPGPEMGMTKEVNLWEFGMESHFGVEACSDFGDIVIGTLANVNDVTPSHGWLHEEKSVMFVDAGYPGATKRSEANGVEWQVAMLPGKRRAP
jgi:IS5 family transposase